MEENRKIWEQLYRDGMFLTYPSEIFVRLFHRFGSPALPERPFFLDHGAGSGNISEFLVRKGCRVVATDISEAALSTLRMRFRFCNLPCPETLLIDTARPLAEQIPQCDAIVAWDSLYYNTAEKAREVIAQLVSRLRPGGLIFFDMPGPKHHFINDAERVGTDTYRFRGEKGLQRGAIICAPATAEDIRHWCPGVEVLAMGSFGSEIDDFTADFVYLVGRKPADATAGG